MTALKAPAAAPEPDLDAIAELIRPQVEALCPCPAPATLGVAGAGVAGAAGWLALIMAVLQALRDAGLLKAEA